MLKAVVGNGGVPWKVAERRAPEDGALGQDLRRDDAELVGGVESVSLGVRVVMNGVCTELNVARIAKVCDFKVALCPRNGDAGSGATAGDGGIVDDGLKAHFHQISNFQGALFSVGPCPGNLGHIAAESVRKICRVNTRICPTTHSIGNPKRDRCMWVGRRCGRYLGDEESVLAAVRAVLAFGNLVVPVLLFQAKSVRRSQRIEGVEILAGREAAAFTGGGSGDAVGKAERLLVREVSKGGVERSR